MPINITKLPHYKGLCYASPCAWDIGTRWSTEEPVIPKGYYGQFLTSTDTVDLFAAWTVEYDGNTYFGGDFATIFQSLGGDYLEGQAGATGVQAYFYIKTPSLTTDIVIKDQNANIIATISNADLVAGSPSTCYRVTIAAPDDFNSAMVGITQNSGINDYGYMTIPGIGSIYSNPLFITEMEVFIQAFFGTGISTVTVDITTEIVVTFTNVYQIFPAYFLDFAQSSVSFNANNIVCP
jgi:hypothetical protein